MEFNKFIWDLYKNSPDGQLSIARDTLGHVMKESRDSAPFLTQLIVANINEDSSSDDGEYSFETVNIRGLIGQSSNNVHIANQDEADAYFVNIADNGAAWKFEDEQGQYEIILGGGKDDTNGYIEIINAIDGITAGLHDIYPEYFFPYLFARRFDLLEKILATFDVEIPEIPEKQKPVIEHCIISP